MIFVLDLPCLLSDGISNKKLFPCTIYGHLKKLNADAVLETTAKLP